MDIWLEVSSGNGEDKVDSCCTRVSSSEML